MAVKRRRIIYKFLTVSMMWNVNVWMNKYWMLECAYICLHVMLDDDRATTTSSRRRQRAVNVRSTCRQERTRGGHLQARRIRTRAQRHPRAVVRVREIAETTNASGRTVNSAYCRVQRLPCPAWSPLTTSSLFKLRYAIVTISMRVVTDCLSLIVVC